MERSRLTPRDFRRSSSSSPGDRDLKRLMGCLADLMDEMVGDQGAGEPPAETEDDAP